MTKKPVLKKKPEVPQVSQQVAASWGGQTVEGKDMVIPRLYALSSNSDLVVKFPDEYRGGDIIRSTDKKVLGNTKKGVEFICISYSKKWKIQRLVGNEYKFNSFEAYNEETAALPWEFMHNGIQFRRNEVVEFIVLLKSDIEKEKEAMLLLENEGIIPDVDSAMLPTCISFERTSYNSGRTLLTHFSKAEYFGMNPAVSMFSLTTLLQSKDNNNWFILNVEPSGKSDEYSIAKAGKWFKTMQTAKTKIHDEVDGASKTDVTTTPKNENVVDAVAENLDMSAPPPVDTDFSQAF